jgi:Gram-negative bacterial TonB protein C-terminal
MLAVLLLALAVSAQAQTPTFAPVVRHIEYQDIATGQFGVRDGQTKACENTKNPEPIDTPNPLLGEGKTVVDAVIGWDGKVYSAFVLETSSQGSVRTVMGALRSWRFRPATCNGVPIDTSGRIVFVKK